MNDEMDWIWSALYAHGFLAEIAVAAAMNHSGT